MNLLSHSDQKGGILTALCWRKSSAYHLPRVEITNFNGEELERRLTAWFKN
jgi:hypothetical protein